MAYGMGPGKCLLTDCKTSRRVVSIFSNNPNCSMFPQQLGHLSNVFMLISTSQSEFVVWRIPRFSLQFDVEMSVAIWRNIIKLINVVKDNLEKCEKLNLSGAQFRLDWWIKSEDSWLMPHNLCQAGRGGGPGGWPPRNRAKYFQLWTVLKSIPPIVPWLNGASRCSQHHKLTPDPSKHQHSSGTHLVTCYTF